MSGLLHSLPFSRWANLFPFHLFPKTFCRLLPCPFHFFLSFFLSLPNSQHFSHFIILSLSLSLFLSSTHVHEHGHRHTDMDRMKLNGEEEEEKTRMPRHNTLSSSSSVSSRSRPVSSHHSLTTPPYFLIR